MNSMMKCLVALVTIASAQAAACALGQAQSQPFPSKPVTIVVTAAAGGLTDIVARAVGQRLGELWGQQVIIENKGGAGHNIGAASVAKATPDGYTLMSSESSTFTINPSINAKGKLLYDSETDFAPISGFVRNYQTIVVNPSLGVSNVNELMALAKSKPGELNYGTAGYGTAPHLTMLSMESLAGVKFVAVHYRGAGPAVNDLIGGHIKSMALSTALSIPPANGGLVKMLAVSSAKRLPQLPDVPTLSESWRPGYEANLWFGLFAPRATPKEIVNKINADVQRVLSDREFRDKMLYPQLLEPIMGSPEQLTELIKADTEKWGKVIRDANLKVE